jgi:2'-5' RNA ligase
VEKTSYQQYGYRGVGSHFNPHITLGRIPSSEISVEHKKIADNFMKHFHNKPVTFKQLVFFELGESGTCRTVLATVGI